MYMRAYAELLLAYHIPLRFEAELAAAARHSILALINIAIGHCKILCANVSDFDPRNDCCALKYCRCTDQSDLVCCNSFVQAVSGPIACFPELIFWSDLPCRCISSLAGVCAVWNNSIHQSSIPPWTSSPCIPPADVTKS